MKPEKLVPASLSRLFVRLRRRRLLSLIARDPYKAGMASTIATLTQVADPRTTSILWEKYLVFPRGAEWPPLDSLTSAIEVLSELGASKEDIVRALSRWLADMSRWAPEPWTYRESDKVRTYTVAVVTIVAQLGGLELPVHWEHGTLARILEQVFTPHCSWSRCREITEQFSELGVPTRDLSERLGKWFASANESDRWLAIEPLAKHGVGGITQFFWSYLVFPGERGWPAIEKMAEAIEGLTQRGADKESIVWALRRWLEDLSLWAPANAVWYYADSAKVRAYAAAIIRFTNRLNVFSPLDLSPEAVARLVRQSFACGSGRWADCREAADLLIGVGGSREDIAEALGNWFRATDTTIGECCKAANELSHYGVDQGHIVSHLASWFGDACVGVSGGPHGVAENLEGILASVFEVGQLLEHLGHTNPVPGPTIESIVKYYIEKEFDSSDYTFDVVSVRQDCTTSGPERIVSIFLAKEVRPAALSIISSILKRALQRTVVSPPSQSEQQGETLQKGKITLSYNEEILETESAALTTHNFGVYR